MRRFPEKDAAGNTWTVRGILEYLVGASGGRFDDELIHEAVQLVLKSLKKGK